MRYFLVLCVLFGVVSCGGKRVEIGISELQGMYDEVKECMVASDIEPPTLNVVDADKVRCSGFDKDGCYNRSSKTISFAKDTTKGLIKHEINHHVCAEMYEQEGEVYRDPNHDRCKTPDGDNAYLACSSLIIDG